MGGNVSKTKFVNPSSYTVCHYFEIDGYPLCGGMAPVYYEMLVQLSVHNVGLIVTTMIEPLHGGRTIDHKPFGFETGDDNTEWTEGDSDIEIVAKSLGMELYHAPVADAGIPTSAITEKLITKVKEFHAAFPEKKIYVHCWQGKKRTSLVLIILLREVFGVSAEDATELLFKYNNRFQRNAFQSHQWNYVASAEFPMLAEGIYDVEKNDPVIKTPKDHKCYSKEEE